MYTETELKALKKDDLVKIILKQQAVTEQLDLLTSKIQRLEERFDEVQSINMICKNTSTLLKDRVRKLECDILKAQQYSRRECLDVVGIDNEINDEDLEGQVCDIIGNI